MNNEKRRDNVGVQGLPINKNDEEALKDGIQKENQQRNRIIFTTKCLRNEKKPNISSHLQEGRKV